MKLNVTPISQIDSVAIAKTLRPMGGLMWLDAASDHAALNQVAETDSEGTNSEGIDSAIDHWGESMGRYSFISAGPIRRHAVPLAEWERCWGVIDEVTGRCERRRLAVQRGLNGPLGMAGGCGGVIGYEAGVALERVGMPAGEELSNHVLHLSEYDFAVRVDHAAGRADLIAVAGSAAAAEAAEAIARLGDASDGTGQENDAADATDADVRQRVQSNFAKPGASEGLTFADAVDDIVGRIRRGDSFQVNLAQTLMAQTDRDPFDLYLKLRSTNAAPMGGYYDAGSYQVLSSSPEGFVRVRDRLVETRPIKGTVARTGDAVVDAAAAETLILSEKDRAENIMIVDLMRNDLSRVCQDASIEVGRLCQIERYRYVQHLVSSVTGRLRDDASVAQLLAAAFPGGSVTGAPKIEAMRTIATLEPHRRGPYCGSMGYVSPGGDADFNILIRTMTHRDGRVAVPVGGGITARSVAEREDEETWIKAEGMLRAL